jgi:hypothetical protein
LEHLVADTNDYTDVAGLLYLSFAAGISRCLNGMTMHGVYSPEPLSTKLDNMTAHAVLTLLFVMQNTDSSAWQLDLLKDVLCRLGKEDKGSSHHKAMAQYTSL